MERYSDIKGELDEHDMAPASSARTSLSLVRHPSRSNSRTDTDTGIDNTSHAMSGMGIISPPSVSRPAASTSTNTSARPRSNLFSLLKRDSISEMPEIESATGGRLKDQGKKRWTKRASRKPPPPPVKEEAERDERDDSPDFDFELDWERIRTLPRVRLVPPEDEGEPIMLYPIPHPSTLLPSASQACVPPSLLSATIAATSEATDPLSLPSSSPAAPVAPPDGVTPNSLAHATFASSQHSHWVGMSDQFILPPPVFSRRTATAGAFGSPNGSPGRGRGAAVIMPKTRRQVEADIGKRMSMVQHRKRESLEIMRNALLPPLEEATQSPPNVMLPPLEVDEIIEEPSIGVAAGKVQDTQGDETLAQMRDISGEAAGSTRTMWRVSLEGPTGGVKSPELPYAGAARQEHGDLLQPGLGAAIEIRPLQAETTSPISDELHPTAPQELPSAGTTHPMMAVPDHDTTGASTSSAEAPILGEPPAETKSTRKKRALSLSATLARSKSDQGPASSAPPVPIPPRAAPDMKKQRSLKKLFFPSSASHGEPSGSGSTPPVPPITAGATSAESGGIAWVAKKRHTMQGRVPDQLLADNAMSPISAMNCEASTQDVQQSSSDDAVIKGSRARSKSMKSRSKRPDLVISLHQSILPGASFDPNSSQFVAEPEPFTPALTTASTVNHSAVIRTPDTKTAPKRDTDRRGSEQDTGVGAVKSISKRFSLGNLSAAFKRKSSVPNISAAMAAQMARGGSTSSESSCGGPGGAVPAVPVVPDAYKKAKGKKERHGGDSDGDPMSKGRKKTVDNVSSAAWPVSTSAATPDRRRSFDTLPTSESNFPPTILQLLPSPTIRPTAAPPLHTKQNATGTAQQLPTVRDSRRIELERDRTSIAEYRNKRRGSRFDFDFDTAFEVPIPPPTAGQTGRAEEVSPKTITSPISPALASIEGNCLYSSPGHDTVGQASASSYAHSSRHHEDVRRESWGDGALSTESGEALLGSREHGRPCNGSPEVERHDGQAEAGSRGFFDYENDSDEEFGETEVTSIVHAQILPVSPTSRRPYESMQRHLSHVSGGRAIQVEPEYTLSGKRQSVQALVLGSPSVDGHSVLDTAGADIARGPQTAPIAEGRMRESMAQALNSIRREEQASNRIAKEGRGHRSDSHRPPTVVSRRDTEPVVKMAAPLVIDLRGQYARRFTQPNIRTGSLPVTSALSPDATVPAPRPPVHETPRSAPPMQPTMVPLKDDSCTDQRTRDHNVQSMSRISSTELSGLASRQTVVHVPSMPMSRNDTEEGSESMSRSDSASSASTQVIPTTPSSLALLRMMEPEALSLDDPADAHEAEEPYHQVGIRHEPDLCDHGSRVHLSTIPLPVNDHGENMPDHDASYATIDQTFEHDPEMDRLAAELEGGEVNVEVAIAVSQSVIMGSTISASDIASMAHIASLVESPKSAENVRRTAAASPSTSLRSHQGTQPSLEQGDSVSISDAAAFPDHVSVDDMSDSSSMVLVDSPSIPPEWLASITPPTQDKRARSNPLAKANFNKAAKAMKAATYKGRAKHIAPVWAEMPMQTSLWRDNVTEERRSPSHLSPSPQLRDSPISLGSASNGTDGSTTPKSGRFPSPEALFRLLHSPRSRRASADADDALGGPSTALVNGQSYRGVAQDQSGRQVMTDPVRPRPLPALPDEQGDSQAQAKHLPHIEGLPRACEVERQGTGQERWTMWSAGQGLELSEACFDALGLDLNLGEDVRV